MRARLPLIVLFFALAIWLVASYGLRYGLMEDPQWVGTCVAQTARWECQLRANLGWLIHFRVLGWIALIASVLAFFVRGRVGYALAVLALLFGFPALALYNASLAVFAVVIAALRLVRAPRS
ncbi:hypothetical protein FJD38_02035 [Pseudomonas saxonica]|uniref:Uncharacterized protein n=1 Tax=Pseudomonas saxonica TaxID=2600598 RepID=A0ABY3GL46_9PSED|nr:hypothetical protein [Pseudomonas saxonica]TWR92423.1 hypothetical protein FJD38_02035 [Pseudomonas saxonica]